MFFILIMKKENKVSEITFVFEIYCISLFKIGHHFNSLSILFKLMNFEFIGAVRYCHVLQKKNLSHSIS